MKAVLTGDIVRSQDFPAEIWLGALKDTLNDASGDLWEIYRGDEFQILMDRPEEAFIKSLQIKSALKKIPDLDVRIAIGLGEVDFKAEKLAESNGSAFVNSGRLLERIKTEKNNLAVSSPVIDFDETFNLIFIWMGQLTDNWSTVSAEIMNIFLKQPEINQEEAARQLNITQSSVSQRLKRAGYEQIMHTDRFFRKKIAELQDDLH